MLIHTFADPVGAKGSRLMPASGVTCVKALRSLAWEKQLERTYLLRCQSSFEILAHFSSPHGNCIIQWFIYLSIAWCLFLPSLPSPTSAGTEAPLSHKWTAGVCCVLHLPSLTAQMRKWHRLGIVTEHRHHLFMDCQASTCLILSVTFPTLKIL